jgi:hypothetical protein
MTQRKQRVSQQVKLSQHKEWLRQEKRKELGSIAGLSPTVKSVKMTLSFSDPDGFLSPHQETCERGPESSAFFWIACYSHECVDGGFDLTTEFKQAVEEKRTEVSGSRVCDGWQDRERIGKHRCYCHLDYKIECTYH